MWRTTPRRDLLKTENYPKVSFEIHSPFLSYRRYMPLLDSVVLANPRGGSGKSTLAFHLSALYAKLHPETKVVVLDASIYGDSSALLLGSHETRRQL